MSKTDKNNIHIPVAIKKKVASEIFSLAHQYANEDPEMIGAMELQARHYYAAIHKVGRFQGR